MKKAFGGLRAILGGVYYECSILLLVGLTMSSATAADSLIKVRLLLDVPPTGTHTPFFVAKDHGFYKDAGLDVEITAGTGSADTAKLVGVGRATFGYADAGTALISEAAGVPLVMIAAFPRQTMLTIFGLADKGIHSLHDLENKSIGLAAGTAEAKLFPALATKNGLDLQKVKIVAVSYPTRVPALLAGNVDAIGGFYTSYEDIAAQLKNGHDGLTALKYSDYGISLYGNGLLVNTDFARDNPAVVSAFVKATMRGLAFAIEHPDDALESTLKAIPTGDRGLIRSRWFTALPFMRDADTRGPDLGIMTETEWKSTQDLMVQYGGQAKPLELDHVYTNDYLRSR